MTKEPKKPPRSSFVRSLSVGVVARLELASEAGIRTTPSPSSSPPLDQDRSNHHRSPPPKPKQKTQAPPSKPPPYKSNLAYGFDGDEDDDFDLEDLPRVRVIKSALKGSSSGSSAYIINSGSRGGAGVGVIRGTGSVGGSGGATPRASTTPRTTPRGSLEVPPGSPGSAAAAAAAAGAAVSRASSANRWSPSVSGELPPDGTTPVASVARRASVGSAADDDEGGSGALSSFALSTSIRRSCSSTSLPASAAGFNSNVAGKVARKHRAAASATLRALLSGSSSSPRTPATTPRPPPLLVPTFAVSCRECASEVERALEAAGVPLFEVFGTEGGVADEGALSAAVSAVVGGIESERDDVDDDKRDGGAKLVLSVCHRDCKHASDAVSSWVAAGGRHLARPPTPRSPRRSRRSDGVEDPVVSQNCGVSVAKAVVGALVAVWNFLVDSPPTEEERRRRREKEAERRTREEARRNGESSTTSVLVPERKDDGENRAKRFASRPLKHDADGAPVSLETAVDAFAVEKAEEEWTRMRREMAARAAAASAGSPPSPSRASAPPEGQQEASCVGPFEPALHEFAPPELSREARATAVRNALRGVRVGEAREGDGDGDRESEAAASVTLAVAEEGARLSAAALLKALCRAASSSSSSAPTPSRPTGTQLAASVVVAALRLEGAAEDGKAPRGFFSASSPSRTSAPRCSFSVLRKGWCEVDGARRCYYFES